MARGSMWHSRGRKATSLETSGQAPRVGGLLRWPPTHHHGLLHQGVAVLTHVLQDLVGCVVTGCGRGLRSHGQGVDEGLGEHRGTFAHA